MNVWLRHRVRHAVHSIVLLGSLFVLAAALAWCIGGATLTWIVLGTGAALVLSRPTLGGHEALDGLRARALLPDRFPRLNRLVSELAERAGLRRTPALYWVPDPTANAAVLGTGGEVVVVLTSRVIRELDEAELRSLLAHELSHVRNNDVWIMGLARCFLGLSRCLRRWYFITTIILLAFADRWPDPWSCLVVAMAPGLVEALYLAMSRTRELKADLHAARLVRDPLCVARALRATDEGGTHELTERFSTHPSTRRRIERLEALSLGAR